ncbi:MAG: membrane protein insertase YidC [Acidobacteriota bacterium]
MEKRYIVFIVLAFLVMAGWQVVVSRLYPESTKVAKQQQQQPQEKPTSKEPTVTPPPTNQSLTPTPVTSPVGTPVEAVTARTITVETPLWRAVFDNRGAVVKSMTMKQLPDGRELRASDYGQLELVSQEGLAKVGAPFRLEVNENPELTKRVNESYYRIEQDGDTLQINRGEEKDLIFNFQDGTGLTVSKRLHFYGDQYLFDVAVDASLNGQPLPTSLLIGPNFGDQSVKQVDSYTNTPQQVIVEHGNNKVEFLTAADLQKRSAPPDKERSFSDDVKWVASADHYFAMTVISPAKLPKATIRNDFTKELVDGNETYKDYLSIQFPVLNSQNYQVFVGPKDRQLFQDINKRLGGRADLEDLINYGMFSFLVKPIVPVLELLLKGFYKLTSNYGWAIILMTLIINMLFFPLRWKSSVAMKKVAKLQPKMKELQEKMKKLKKDDPRLQELQLEQVKLMKEGNMFAGCLPMLMQIPIFWAFFIYLTISIDVRHSPFIFWIKDLAGPDPTYILPIIMTVSMMAYTALTPTPNDPSQKMQKIMTSYLMPILLLFLFFLKAPSGLVLYWMFGNIVSIGQQLIINKMTVEPASPATADKAESDKTPRDKNRTQTGDLANVR